MTAGPQQECCHRGLSRWLCVRPFKEMGCITGTWKPLPVRRTKHFDFLLLKIPPHMVQDQCLFAQHRDQPKVISLPYIITHKSFSRSSMQMYLICKSCNLDVFICNPIQWMKWNANESIEGMAFIQYTVMLWLFCMFIHTVSIGLYRFISYLLYLWLYSLFEK